MGTREHLLRSSSGIDHYLRHEGDGSIHLESHQDAQPFLEQNKAMANHNDGYNPTRDMRRVASIPNIVLMQWRQEIGSDPLHPSNEAWLRRRLNDPDWRHLRTAPGRL